MRLAVVLILICAAQICEAQDSKTQQALIEARQKCVVKLFGAGVGSLDSYGSGVVVSAEGHVVTVWNHLVSTGFLTAVTHDGRRLSVETIGTSAEYDLAVLKLKADPGESFVFADLAQAADPEPGSSVLAFSNMFRVASGNEPVSVVHGVIAGKVPLEATQGRWKFPFKGPVWLIDAITNNSGAAGGLLTDSSGRPVGLIGREIRHAASRTWVNYAVPMTALKPVIEALFAGRKVDTPRNESEVAASLTDQQLSVRYGLTLLPDVLERTPAFVDNVAPGSKADQCGLRRGDLIVLIGETVITGVRDVQQRMAGYRPGEKVQFTVNRDQELITVELRAAGE